MEQIYEVNGIGIGDSLVFLMVQLVSAPVPAQNEDNVPFLSAVGVVSTGRKISRNVITCHKVAIVADIEDEKNYRVLVAVSRDLRLFMRVPSCSLVVIAQAQVYLLLSDDYWQVLEGVEVSTRGYLKVKTRIVRRYIVLRKTRVISC